MKCVICAALALALLCVTGLSGLAASKDAAPDAPDAPVATVAPGSRLGLEALRLTADGAHNQFVSPVSLAWALSMAAQGASGDTLAALLTALDADDAGDIAALADALAQSGLRQANAAFVRSDLPLREGYAEALQTRFGGELFTLDAADRVNAWVRKQTDGLIEQLLDAEPDPDIRLMLVNAIAMDANWQVPFEADRTQEDVFHAPGGDVRADFMRGTLSARYAEIDGTQVIRLDYYGSDLYMLVALPPEGGVPALLDALAERGAAAIAPGDAPREVDLRLPKLDVAAQADLTGPLTALGLELPFSNDADFSGISPQGLKISEVLQKVRVQVDELGTRAAAATEVGMKANGARMQLEKPVEMTVDRPFVVLIADDATGALCFAGVVADPAE